jgi:hypothetical protein
MTHHESGHLQVLLDCNSLRELHHWYRLHQQRHTPPCRGAAALLMCGCFLLLLVLLLLLEA